MNILAQIVNSLRYAKQLIWNITTNAMHVKELDSLSCAIIAFLTNVIVVLLINYDSNYFFSFGNCLLSVLKAQCNYGVYQEIQMKNWRKQLSLFVHVWVVVNWWYLTGMKLSSSEKNPQKQHIEIAKKEVIWADKGTRVHG